MAATLGHLEIVKYYTVTCAINYPTRGSIKEAQLHLAARGGHLNVVKFLIEDMKCDPNLKGHLGWRPIHNAIIKGHFEVAKYLISNRNCDVSSAVLFGLGKSSPLQMAVHKKHIEIFKLLITAHRLDPYLQQNKKKLLKAAKEAAVLDYVESYSDPLHEAAKSGDIDMVKHYIEKENWSPMMLDRFGNNTLHNAAKYGHLNVVKYLTDPLLGESAEFKACDPLAINKYGLTAQELASQGDHQPVVSYLLQITDQPVFNQHALSPSLSIFVLGNSGAGKSTLVKALSKETGIIGNLRKLVV